MIFLTNISEHNDIRSYEKTPFIIDIEGYEGPLHLLLELAKQQKLDLSKISVLELAEQYLQFIEHMQKIEIEIATDYLVMAAWLTYLKSRLLLPVTSSKEEEPDSETLARRITFQLKKLDAMKRAGKKLLTGIQWKIDVFGSGQAEKIQSKSIPYYETQLYDLLKAYGTLFSRQILKKIQMPNPNIFKLEEARSLIETTIQEKAKDWVSFTYVLNEIKQECLGEIPAQSFCASSFAASLELVKEEKLTLRQNQAFDVLYLKVRKT